MKDRCYLRKTEEINTSMTYHAYPTDKEFKFREFMFPHERPCVIKIGFEDAFLLEEEGKPKFSAAYGITLKRPECLVKCVGS
jgi:hypothetical protein